MITQTPDSLIAFQSLGFVATGSSGVEFYGDCVFCGKSNKLYINADTRAWQCKSASCGREGSFNTFLSEWISVQQAQYSEEDKARRLASLSRNRRIPVEALKAAGMFYDDPLSRWIMPIYGYINGSGKIGVVNLKSYRPDAKLVKLTGLKLVEQVIYGLPDVISASKKKSVWVCEGEWDAIALRAFFQKLGRDELVVGIPGAGTFKDSWIEYFSGRDVILAYDADSDGRKGAIRAGQKLKDTVSNLKWVQWPDEVPDKYDIRDFCSSGTEIDVLLEMLRPVPTNVSAMLMRQSIEKDGGRSLDVDSPDNGDAPRPYDHFPLLDDSRIEFSELLSVYGKWLYLSEGFVDILKISIAVIYSNQIDGTPLWMHIVGPPGTGKTEALLSVSKTEVCRWISTLTPHTLVSGYNAVRGVDPSLLPKLDHRTCIIKDLTEVLGMPDAAKDEIFSTLRGAFDGEVDKPFGHNVVRKYKAHFSVLTGVTQKIFGERDATQGARFLMYHLRPTEDQIERCIDAAMAATGQETVMKEQCSDAARSFIEYRIPTGDDQLQVPPQYVERIKGLCRVVAALRTSVDRDYSRKHISYTPEQEVGTRLAKQFTKLIIGLGLINNPPSIGEEEYRIVSKVALDSCIGFHTTVLAHLMESDGLQIHDLDKTCGMTHDTLQEVIEDMHLIGVLKKDFFRPVPKAPLQVRYFQTERIKSDWQRAQLNGHLKDRILRDSYSMSDAPYKPTTFLQQQPEHVEEHVSAVATTAMPAQKSHKSTTISIRKVRPKD